ncbi:recombinase family protein [Duganella sp. HH105]|uniref:recombinase family protein n=1 Tax=Duganella sp. HH105 TaxID=1781067 RepID=UPI00089366D9|nr:recombinase family protein [Duganella sp. HH105]OEZ54850.1 hypothetical protein DUGA6_56210 [Duganella sp. HH105]
MTTINQAVGSDVERAAAYVRMSTSAQALSPKLQEGYLRRYAHAHRMEVVRVYNDDGKSGLVLAGRTAMQQLLNDVAGGCAGFTVLLIYDVSRWGRYQNVDEAGFYEYLCRRAGIRVLYCGEHFVNDGEPLSQLMKSFKRTMAAEYSRELSMKVFAAQKRLTQLGYKQGGGSTYGMRRVTVTADGKVGRDLPPGELKPRRTDRVRLLPGSEEEQATIRRIFQLYNHEGWTAAAIKRLLNAEGVSCGGGLWTDHRVFSVLSGPQYWGTQAYCRTSRKLRTPCLHNPRSQWICCEHALPSVVPQTEGELAQRVRAMRTGQDRTAVLDVIAQVHGEHGRVSYPLLAEVPGMPGGRRLSKMFGSLADACRAAGIEHPSVHGFRMSVPARNAMLATMRDQVLQMAAAAGGSAVVLQSNHNLLRLNDTLIVRVAVACCRLSDVRTRWRIQVHAAEPADFVVAGLLDTQNKTVERWALISTRDERRSVVSFGSGRYAKSRGLLFPTLASLFGLSPPP